MVLLQGVRPVVDSEKVASSGNILGKKSFHFYNFVMHTDVLTLKKWVQQYQYGFIFSWWDGRSAYGFCMYKCMISCRNLQGMLEFNVFYFVTFCNWLGGATGSSWGISSIFGGSDNRTPAKENLINKSYNEPIHNVEQAVSMIHLREVFSSFHYWLFGYGILSDNSTFFDYFSLWFHPDFCTISF